jgi:hypothetical protein
MLLPVLAATVLAACSSAAPESAEPARVEIEPWAGELPIGAPWLREQLPAGTLAYQRIPHPLAMLAIPKGNAFDTALGSEANIQNLVRIQQGLIENLGLELPPARLLQHLRSPIEAAVVAVPSPSAIITTTLSFRSNAELEAFINEFSEHLPVALAGPLDDAGYGQLTGAPVPIHVHFDAATGRLALFGGFFADRSAFTALLTPPAEPTEHPMYALESQIDESGQGLLLWINAAQAIETGRMFMPPEVAEQLAATGADQVRALAAGAGVANGKGRLKVLADLGIDSASRPIPVVHNDITATAVGDPRSLLLLSFPGAGEFTRLETLLTARAGPEAADHWTQVKAMFATASGTSFEELLSAIGPELIMLSDSAGDYLGLHVRDHALVDDVLERWSASRGVTIAERRVQGRTVRYVDWPRAIPVREEQEEGEEFPLARLVAQMRNHVYWVVDGDYLYLASTPQVLIDRIEIGAGTSVAEWLDDTQRVDVSSSLLAATGSAGRLPRMMYNAYIGGMQSFADLVGVDYDVWAMPTANQLGLPDRGTLGATVNLGEPYVSLELSYESNPAEILFGGAGFVAAAAAAAIAMPQMHDRREGATAADAVQRGGVSAVPVAEPAVATSRQ